MSASTKPASESAAPEPVDASAKFVDPPCHTDYSGQVCGELNAKPGRLAAYTRLKISVATLLGDLPTPGFTRHLLSDQFYLAKWLRASDYNADKAVDMLRRHLVWRRENGIDSMSIPYFDDGEEAADQFDDSQPDSADSHVPELIRRYHTGGRCGSDREGRPVFIDPIGQFDMSGLMRRHSIRELVLSRVRIWERLLRRDFPAARRRTGLPVCQAVYVIDLAGFGRRQMNSDGLAYVKELSRVLEANYPELLGSALVLNPKHQRLTQLIWRLMGPLLSPATRQTVRILPEGEAGRATLLAAVPPDQLPAAYGGKLLDPTDNDPACRSLICYGGQVPSD
ncbi:hypothetical protein BOX15_Mlig032121g1 [Macrostomum lignano]|uniref:CRAL-TRIO domain-containing protein n=1 Tax=Macrostomum lignano TaxID=282301 RepID=A0A267E828_9PLAT|nr:hypothetical protein BOX15_Mlig032121g1 [Macrostomum lignano]